MPKPLLHRPHQPVLTRLLLLVATVALSACAAKNPLMTEPAATPMAKKKATTVVAKPDPAAQASNAIKSQALQPAPANAQKPASATAVIVAKPAPAALASIATTPSPPPSFTKRWLGIFSPYKIDIQQGNFISQEMASQLKEGLTKEQVRFLLGVPLLTDMFHAGRWDYLFRLQKANGQITANRLTIYFKDNRVTHFESTQLPDEAAYISHISGTPPTPAKEAPKPTPETKPATK